MNQPDARKHQLISFVKSGIRIFGCLVAAITSSVALAISALAIALLVAEIVGVYEELV